MDSPDTSTAGTDVSADVASSSGLRRRLLGAGLIGLAGSLVPSVAAHAAASPDQATTTTAPPKRPSDDDLVLLRFAMAAELAATSLYSTALASELGEATIAAITHIRDAHLAFGQALNAEIGTTAPDAPDAAILAASVDAFAGTRSAMLSAGLDLENILVATHTDVIGRMTGIDGARLIGSIITAEARHALALADLAGLTELDDLLGNDAIALTPAEG